MTDYALQEKEDMDMALSKILPVAAAAWLVAGLAPVAAQQVVSSDAGLAADTIADGRTMQAIAQLEAELELYPGDPAVLINLGIAHAQSGNETEARLNFEAAMRSRDVVELETANGRTTDSRRLARHALTMLDRGEFKPEPRTPSQFTLRN
ncbi:MAG: hypothetical protein ACX930_08645 [Erythrobacter sp.]